MKTSTILLSGADWKLGSFAMDEGEGQGAFQPGFGERGFRIVEVPGNVQLQLGLGGMNLYYQSKELTLINQREWWYRKRFVVPQGVSGKLVRLVFEGVDYFATVWLNGKRLGEHEGCFVRFSYDVSSSLNYGGDNLLVVRVTCPWLPKGRGFLEYMKGEWAEVVPGWAVRFPFPPYVLGPTWDGLPAGGNAVFPMGLWRDVKLVISGSTVIDDLFVTTRSLNPDGSATLGVSGTIKNYDHEDVSGVLELRIAPENFAGEPLALPKQTLKLHSGENTFSAEAPLKNPRLWWTWDLGEQSLYKATATISSGVAGRADTRETLFGIRTIARKSDMSYWLNGKRLFLKGAWYPMADYFGSKPSRETYERDLEMYRAANLNHLVGFTVVEKPDFYDLCDRLGILVMFEFPFIQFGPMEVLSPSNPRRDTYIRESQSQIRQIVIMLRNHPSIIVWAPFAEAHEKSGRWGVGDEDFEKYGYAEFVDQIGRVVTELSPGTIFHPSLCDVGEQHFWMANAGMGTATNYTEQFNANTGFVSEYGSVALPAYETLRKMLSPEEMWSSRNQLLPSWYNLPINVSVYAYQTSFDFDGLASLLHRVNQFVNRHVKSVRELIDDSQLYQAFVFKYATEAYRRKKYGSINGTRIWAYGEVCPGIRFNFLDYFRTPKMGYYYLKNAQERFAVNFAYEEALESQPAGKRLRIPVWVINDYRREVPFELHCEIRDLEGQKLWSENFSATIGSDESREVGVVDWVTPAKPGVYVLSAKASEKGGELEAKNSTFIKVTPRLFSREIKLLVIGQKKYSRPIAEMALAMGLNVRVIQEETVHQLARLRDPEAIRKNYDVVWLASFDSLWKLLDNKSSEGLKQAIHQGVGFIHTGGPGSFHGGSIRAACLDFTPLAEVLPVKLRSRDDLVFGPVTGTTFAIAQGHLPLKDIQAKDATGMGWGTTGLAEYGLAGFNDVDLKPGTDPILTISSRPLLVISRYGQGRTVAFTGFTPEYAERRADWDARIVFPYLLDQEFISHPESKAYFALFMRMMAAALGEELAPPYEEILAARDKPLFETLGDLPAARLEGPERLTATISANKATVSFNLTNRERYARLVRLRAEWNQPEAEAPYLVLYGDNYFDLLPGETKPISLDLFLRPKARRQVSGQLIVEGSNVSAKEIPISLVGG